MESIIHRLYIDAPVEIVFENLTTQRGLAGWWTPEAKAQPESGSILRFAFGAGYFKEMKVEELKRPRKIKWVCVKGYKDWIGTTITFELEKQEQGTSLYFHHDGWKKAARELGECSYDWAMFMRSLRFLCETGKGFPYPIQYK
jgi:uncharacterized protein YndB with AHSA1/START domain